MIELDNISVRSGTFSLSSVSLTVPAGTYAVLMGATGQGKSTILEAICGLKAVLSGRILLNDQEITDWKPAHRGVGYVPQDLALFPTMSVREHLEFALRLRRVGREERTRRVEELSQLLGIERLLERKVRGLSGGEAQRVALGRALSFQPPVLLMDEPLNALDEATRDRLCELLKRIQQASGLTILHVTHSRDEARTLAEKLFWIEAGQVQERPVAMLEEEVLWSQR